MQRSTHATNESLADASAVANLAHDGITRHPQAHLAVATAVTEAIRSHLIHGD